MPTIENNGFTVDETGAEMRRLADTDHSISPAAHARLVDKIQDGISYSDIEKLRAASPKLFKQAKLELTLRQATAPVSAKDTPPVMEVPAKSKPAPSNKTNTQPTPRNEPTEPVATPAVDSMNSDNLTIDNGKAKGLNQADTRILSTKPDPDELKDKMAGLINADAENPDHKLTPLECSRLLDELEESTGLSFSGTLMDYYQRVTDSEIVQSSPFSGDESEIVLTNTEITDIHALMESDRVQDDCFPIERYEAMGQELDAIQTNSGRVGELSITDDLLVYIMELRGCNKFQVECRARLMRPDFFKPWIEDHVDDDVLEDLKGLNDRFATIVIGGRDKVLAITATGSGYEVLDHVKLSERLVSMGKALAGKREVSYAKLWLSWPEHRHIQGGFLFAPDKKCHAIVEHDRKSQYNIFEGFGCKPISGDDLPDIAKLVDRLEQFTLEHVCENNPELQKWMWDWVAFMFKNPAEKVITSQVWRGTHGTGKNLLANVILTMVGHHGAMVLNKNLIFGTFNSVLENSLVLVLNELLITDAEELRKLKGYSSDETIQIEKKFQDPYLANNYNRFIALTNENCAFPLEKEDRRTVVFTFDFVFKDENNKLEAKELEFLFPNDPRFNKMCSVLLDRLLNRDLSKFDPQGLPVHTDGRSEAMQRNMNSVEKWLVGVAHEGYMRNDHEQINAFTGKLTNASVHECYLHFCRSMNIPSSDRLITNNYLRSSEELYSIKRFRDGRTRYVEFPSIEELQRMLIKTLKLRPDYFDK
jgi:hypothetical protein